MSTSKLILIVFGFLLLLSLSFGLGYLVAEESNPAPIVIEKCS